MKSNLNFTLKNYSLILVNFFVLGLFLMGFTFISDNPNYTKEIETWHQERIESLKKEDGWLNLAGLFWLQEGRNSFGADKANNVIFPKGKSEPILGDLVVKNGEVFAEIKPNVFVLHDSQPVESLRIFPYEKLSKPTVLAHNSLRWFVIKRGEKLGVRLRDLESPYLKEFKGIETFPVDENWRIEAKLEPAIDKKIPITDVLGETNLQPSPGSLVFKIKGQTYKLDAIDNGKNLFIIFADKTTKHETYGSGRFLYADKPDADGITYLDFNKATNPPCAFTPYATCPLPPKQNFLPIAVAAGEKTYGNH